MHALAWFFPFFQGLLLGVIAMAFHEVGHLIAAPLVGIKVKTVGLRWKGLYTVREAGPPAKNLIVSLAGPAVNLALLICWPLSHQFGLANFCFLFFNLLPIEGSDGDRVWRCWRHIKRERQHSADAKSPKSHPAPSAGNIAAATYASLARQSQRAGD